MESTKELTLSVVEKDAVGEIANMCMGSAATALSSTKSLAVRPLSWQTREYPT